VLLVLGCTKLGCGKTSGCYKALRCQLPPQQQQQQQHPAEPTPDVCEEPPAAQAAVGFDAFSAADDDWGDAGDWGAETTGAAAARTSTVTGTSCDAFDFSDLVQSLEAAGQQAAAAAAAKAKAKQQPAAETPAAAAAATAAAGSAAASDDVVLCCRAPAGPQLPEFYMYSEAEPGDLKQQQQQQSRTPCMHLEVMT
jgi:hypothetical protein